MIYKYSAINKEGKSESSQMEASSYRDAVAFLHSKGLIPTELTELHEKAAIAFMSKLSTVSLQDKILFVQNLSVMLKAGVPLTKALKILSNQAKNPRMKTILEDIYRQVESGKSLSEALQNYPKIFQNIFVSMFRVGEMSGTLDKSLEYLSIQLQREHELSSKTKGAMIYPAVVVFAIVVVGVLMSIFVLPSLIGIFKDSGMQLPLTTRIVVGFVDFMSNHTFLALGIIVLLIGGIFAIMKTEQGQVIFDKVLLRTPVFGGISKKINMARFSRTMSSMLKGGTPILDSLEIASESMGNTQYRDAIKQAAQDVRVGKSLTSSLTNNPLLFDYIITQMVGVGEESGNIDTILSQLADHFEQEVDDTMRNLSAVIEPVMILIIGTVVGVLAIALISPIYSLTQAAGG